MILISACLLGLATRYDGQRLPAQKALLQWLRAGQILPVCPEQLGGLATPRPPAEIIGGDGLDVLAGCATVMTIHGQDVTGAYRFGAKEAVRLAQLAHIRCAVLKEGSPACGVTSIRDGTFSHTARAGCGVATAALMRAGIAVLGETDWAQAEPFLRG